MAEEEPEETFTFRDRRRGNADVAPVVEPAATIETPVTMVTATPSPTEIEEVADVDFEDDESPEAAGELPDVYSVLMLFLGELRNLAWLRMGFLANPATGQIERDMQQARVAIDTVEFLATKLDPVVTPEERPALKSVVQDLRINYVEQARRGV